MYLMNISRQEEERRRREEEMMIRQREMEEQMRRQREESYSRMGYMDPVSKLLQCNQSSLQNLWIPRVQFIELNTTFHVVAVLPFSFFLTQVFMIDRP